jgi:sortase A
MAAFPQILLWGFALTAIAIGSYFLSRRVRHDSVGLLVGIVPFVVALYFFFQNVNRLLPPGI